jgi:orotate phosphoribosyltransferase
MDSIYESHRARLLGLLTNLSYEKRDVVLSSGQRSTFYIDCKQTALTAEGHYLIGWLFNWHLAREAAEVEAVGGLTLGADPLASATSLLSYLGGRPVHAFYVRKEPKGHGTEEWLEGKKSLRAGMKVAIVEDVVTTGGSTLKAIERATLAGLHVARVLALVDREEGGRATVEKHAPLTALFRRQDFPA